MEKKQENKPTQGYRIGRLTVLELMTVLAALGIFGTWVLRHFLGN